jgi:hypothetical protein
MLTAALQPQLPSISAQRPRRTRTPARRTQARSSRTPHSPHCTRTRRPTCEASHTQTPQPPKETVGTCAHQPESARAPRARRQLQIRRRRRRRLRHGKPRGQSMVVQCWQQLHCIRACPRLHCNVADTGGYVLGGNAKRRERERESGPSGLTREVETPLPSNQPPPTRLRDWHHGRSDRQSSLEGCVRARCSRRC